MGTHLRVLSESYLINTIIALDESSLSIGRVRTGYEVSDNHFLLTLSLLQSNTRQLTEMDDFRVLPLLYPLHLINIFPQQKSLQNMKSIRNDVSKF